MIPTQTLRETIERGARRFERARLYFGHGTDNALDESFHLACFALTQTPAQLERRADRPLTAAEARAIDALFASRIRTRTPAAYLTGEAWFCGRPFIVDERVLIPRSPIAELIEARFQPWLTQTPKRVLDLCAGSGCIGIATAKALPRARVDLAELDAGALAVCRKNLRKHRLSRRVRALQSDLLDGLKGAAYDLIVSNPPYVPNAEWRALPREYRHEPRMALAAGRDGMDLVARILDEAPRYLSKNGVLICEIGGSQRQFEKRFPKLPALWPEFERGGDGVFIISREELIRWKANVG